MPYFGKLPLRQALLVVSTRLSTGVRWMVDAQVHRLLEQLGLSDLLHERSAINDGEPVVAALGGEIGMHTVCVEQVEHVSAVRYGAS